MPKRALFLFAAALVLSALVLSAPALARATDETEAWTLAGANLRADAAGIALPQTIGGLSLAKSGELSNGGKGIDNYAQYLSQDGTVQATLYIYLPSYADASIAAYMTDKAVMDRFGPKTRRTAYESASAGGHRDRAIRAVYDDAADGALTTAAAFVHIGRWMVKMRVTGPAEHRADVLTGLDGMLAALRFDDPAALHATAPSSLSACPFADTADARLTANVASFPDRAGVTLPRDGQGNLCLRGTVTTAQGRYDMIQQAGRPHGAIIVPVDDAGTVLAFDPARAGADYQLSIHSVGQTDRYGVYDRLPSPRQIAAILENPQTAQVRSTTDYAANGRVTIQPADAAPR